jgi:hypothetical protein
MNRRAIRPVQFVLSMVVLAITAPVWAHHSAVGYDFSKTLTAEATIKEFRWVSPHSAVVVVINGPDGEAEDMTVTSATPAVFFKQGFTPRDFKVGDKVEISWHPAKSGHLGGALASMKLPDGREFKDVEFGTAGALAAQQADTVK